MIFSMKKILFIFGLLLSGCATQSPPANFYVLSASAEMTRTAHPKLMIGVGPVSIADYLDRSQIVRRDTDVRLQMDEFNRWAGDHRKNIGAVLADNLARIIGSEAVLPFPWPSSLELDYRIIVDVTRFEATADNVVVLDVQWQLFDGAANKLLTIKRSHIKTVAKEGNHAAQVAAQNRALVKLSEMVADEIISVAAGR
jgi:uncharacterized lipoprotein YmbA